jgi:1-acyl-sn-glycerol-3-phosphate acyltransferase
MTIFRSWRKEGNRDLPSGGLIFAANHNSNAEGPLLNTIRFKPVRFLGKQELFDKPLHGFIQKGLGTIPIKRGKSDNIAMEKAVLALKKGKWIGIFPEGTRGDGRTLGDAHTGVIRLALMADVPIIPVGISGGTKAWPKGRRPRLFKKVHVKIGEPWKVPQPSSGGQYSYDALKELAGELLYERIGELWDRSKEEKHD